KVRLINAPTEAAADPLSLGYRTAAWRLERAAQVAPLIPAHPARQALDQESGTTAEGFLLLEAGCLRAAWDTLSGAGTSLPPQTQDDARASTAYLRSALLCHLELRGLAVETAGQRRLTESCELPDVASIVASLTTRHPTMVAETASLARIRELLPELMACRGDPAAHFASAHWRNLGVAAYQMKLLRRAVLAELEATIARCEPGRLLRLLMAGSEHIAAACDLVERFPNLEITVTDPEPGLLEQSG